MYSIHLALPKAHVSNYAIVVVFSREYLVSIKKEVWPGGIELKVKLTKLFFSAVWQIKIYI